MEIGIGECNNFDVCRIFQFHPDGVPIGWIVDSGD